MRRKLKQSLGVPFLTRELYGFARTDLCFSRCRQVVCEMFIYCYLALHCKIDPRRKNDISSYIWHRSFIQTAKCSLLDKKIVYQSFYSALLMFSYFLLWRKVLCFGMRWRDLRGNYCCRPCRKIYISSYIWHESFIQTVKCSFSNQRNVYQSFCGSLLTLSYFLPQGNVLCFDSRVGKSVTCEMFICRKRSSTLSKKNYLWLVWTQIVYSNGKVLFLYPNNCLSKFLWSAAHV